MKSYKAEPIPATQVEFGTPVQTNGAPGLAVPAGSLGILYDSQGYKVFLPYGNNTFGKPKFFDKFMVPKGFTVGKLTGTMGKKLEGLWDTHTKENLRDYYVSQHPRLGFDPEFFFEDKEGKIVPAWTFLPSKDDAKWDGTYTSKFYWDGFQGEFSFHDSAGACMVGGTGVLKWALDALHSKLPKGVKISSRSLIEVTPDQLLGLPREYVQFGCAPSLSAYNEPHREVENPYQVLTRPAGGHMHFELHDRMRKHTQEYVKAMDALGGLVSVALFEGRDDPRRRELYGRAGEYRTPKHGLEYRVYSNQWLMHPILGYFLMDVTRWAFGLVDAGLMKHWTCTEQEVQEAINSTDAKLARGILTRNKDMFMKLAEKTWYDVEGKGRFAEASWAFVMEGAKEYMDFDIQKNWTTSPTWKAWAQTNNFLKE